MLDWLTGWSHYPEFRLFGPDHLAALLAVAILAPGLPLLARGVLSTRVQYRIASALAAFLLLQEIARVVVRVGIYDQEVRYSLPLHLCSLAALLTAWILWRRSYRAFEVGYFWGLAGTLPALLTPDLIAGFPHPFYFVFFSGHGLIMLGIFYATLVFGFRPRLVSVGKTLVVTLLLMAVIWPVNLLLDANYMYLRSKPAQATLVDYLGAWPWYLLAMIGIGVALCLLIYLPFGITRRRRGGEERPE